MQKRYIEWDEVFRMLRPIDRKDNVVYGVPKGGMIAAGFLQNATNTPNAKHANIILDDIVDSGRTKQFYEERFPIAKFYALIEHKDPNEWIVFPWERDHPLREDSVQENIVRQIEYIGEDPNREGLLETPNRVVRSWQELFAGYDQKLADVLKVFDSDGYNQIVLLKDIEMYSMCEHHMLPFFGKAHVAYIPDGKIIGISKLARLVDIYARRLQTQERIGEQVTCALMDSLRPLGAACIIEATHMCMRMRGISKQQSTMVTSSLRGVFFENSKARAELMSLLRNR